MRSMQRSIFLAVVMAVICSTAVAGASIEPLLAKLMEVYAAHDADGIRALFASDARMVYTGGELVDPDVIGDQYKLVFSQLREGDRLVLRTEVREEWSAGNEIYAWGTYSQLLNDEIVDSGYFTLRAVKEKGGWKLSRAFLMPLDFD